MKDDDVAQTLGRIEAKLDEMKDRLYGPDGQSGDIPRQNMRMVILEEFRNRAMGVILFICAGLTVIGSTLLGHLYGKTK